MMRTALVIAVAAMCAAAASAGLAASGTPAVRVSNMQPVTVTGRAFVPAERVRLVLVVKRARVANVVANRRGRFIVRYPFAVGGCTTVRVTAKGNRGSRASYSIVPTCAAQHAELPDDSSFPIDPQPKKP